MMYELVLGGLEQYGDDDDGEDAAEHYGARRGRLLLLALTIRSSRWMGAYARARTHLLGLPTLLSMTLCQTLLLSLLLLLPFLRLQ